MTHEKLIAEAAQRYPDIEADHETFPTGWSREQERNAFIAGAVFEKALGEATVTPTDDEREALAEIIHRVIEGAYTFEGDLDPSVDETLVRELTAAGFRRPTFPERGEAQEVAMDQATILRETVAQVWPGSVVAAAALAGAEALESAYGKGN